MFVYNAHQQNTSFCGIATLVILAKNSPLSDSDKGELKLRFAARPIFCVFVQNSLVWSVSGPFIFQTFMCEIAINKKLRCLHIMRFFCPLSHPIKTVALCIGGTRVGPSHPIKTVVL